MYYDLLAKIKNAQMARKESFQTSFSKADLEVGKILVAAGYLKDVQKKTVGKKNFLEVKVAYKNQKGVLSDFRLFSKPSRHLYTGYKDLHPVKQNYGIGVLSTSKGIMNNKEARKQQVGGEYLFQVW